MTGSASITGLQPFTSKNELVEELAVFPNPVTDVLVLKVQDANFKSFSLSLRIVDMMGHTIIESFIDRSEAQNSFSTNIAGIPSGIYLLQLSNKNRVFDKRIATSRHFQKPLYAIV